MACASMWNVVDERGDPSLLADSANKGLRRVVFWGWPVDSALGTSCRASWVAHFVLTMFDISSASFFWHF